MERQLPAGLSEIQRSALSEFFAGHISAGQLTQRLGIDAPPPARDSFVRATASRTTTAMASSKRSAIRSSRGRRSPTSMTSARF